MIERRELASPPQSRRICPPPTPRAPPPLLLRARLKCRLIYLGSGPAHPPHLADCAVILSGYSKSPSLSIYIRRPFLSNALSIIDFLLHRLTRLRLLSSAFLAPHPLPSLSPSSFAR